MAQAERLSVESDSFYIGYSIHIQRYAFAEQFCSGARVLDAGCGTGYGSAQLAMGAAESVTGVDIADEAIAEAKRVYIRGNLRFLKGNVEQLTAIPELGSPFDVAVNLENLEHLNDPVRFLAELRLVLKQNGIFVVSSPNGQLTELDERGKPKNPFHVKEFTEQELRAVLDPHFGSIEFYGQWRTPDKFARIAIERRLFDVLCELYYSPSARLWRLARKMLGRKCAPPPEYSGEWGSFAGDWTIKPLDAPPFPWAPEVILAVCR